MACSRRPRLAGPSPPIRVAVSSGGVSSAACYPLLWRGASADPLIWMVTQTRHIMLRKFQKIFCYPPGDPVGTPGNGQLDPGRGPPDPTTLGPSSRSTWTYVDLRRPTGPRRESRAGGAPGPGQRRPRGGLDLESSARGGWGRAAGRPSRFGGVDPPTGAQTAHNGDCGTWTLYPPADEGRVQVWWERCLPLWAGGSAACLAEDLPVPRQPERPPPAPVRRAEEL